MVRGSQGWMKSEKKEAGDPLEYHEAARKRL
jgi:hypothetical protein